MMFEEIITQDPRTSTHPNASRIHAEMLEIELEISKLQERYNCLSSQLNRSSSVRQNLPKLIVGRVGTALGRQWLRYG